MTKIKPNTKLRVIVSNLTVYCKFKDVATDRLRTFILNELDNNNILGIASNLLMEDGRYVQVQVDVIK